LRRPSTPRPRAHAGPDALRTSRRGSSPSARSYRSSRCSTHLVAFAVRSKGTTSAPAFASGNLSK
jgi:hypothetical protein